MDILVSLLSIFAVILVSLALLIGLLSAPWQILLLLLLLGLLSIRWVMQQSHVSAADAFPVQSTVESAGQPTSTSPPPPALTYRGASYQLSDLSNAADSNLTEGSPVEVSGNYRGSTWKPSQPIKNGPH